MWKERHTSQAILPTNEKLINNNAVGRENVMYKSYTFKRRNSAEMTT
jgi:hypothetical protein